MNKKDLISIGIVQRYFLTLRWYKEPCVGIRKLGTGRYALDFSYLSIIFEKY